MTPGEASSYLNTPIAVMPAPGGPSSFRETYREALTALMGIVGLVLLIACVNVANLLLARAERQRAAVSLQLALGASRLGLIRQSLLESLVLSTLGALVGLAMAHWGGQWLVAQLPSTGGRAFLDVSLDWRVLGFTTALATAVAILFGTAPASARDTRRSHGRAERSPRNERQRAGTRRKRARGNSVRAVSRPRRGLGAVRPDIHVSHRTR